MEGAMVVKVISGLKKVSTLKRFPETRPISLFNFTLCDLITNLKFKLLLAVSSYCLLLFSLGHYILLFFFINSTRKRNNTSNNIQW